jgi:hypothetical protein
MCERERVRMNKLIAATAGVAAIGIGALTVGSLLPASAVQTQEEEQQQAPAEDGTVERVWPRQVLAAALAALVEDGTLTQAQADAVTAEVRERIEALPDRPRGPRHRIVRAGLETSAETIGIEVAPLRDALRHGQSIAEVAQANGVDPQAVIDALVAGGNAAIDEAVANGRIDDERAAELRAGLAEHAEHFVNRTFPADDDGD